jgi:hypothetical protein
MSSTRLCKSTTTITIFSSLPKYHLRICAVYFNVRLCFSAFLDHCCGDGLTSIFRQSLNFLGWSDSDPNILTQLSLHVLPFGEAIKVLLVALLFHCFFA